MKSLNMIRSRPLFYNIIKNAKNTGNIRKTSWIYKRALKGFFKDIKKGDVEQARNFANHIDSIITVLNSVHGNNWDFNLNPSIVLNVFEGFELSCVIHYPEISITNSVGLQHKMKDLFVVFNISDTQFENEDGLPVYGPTKLKGTRSTLSYEEWFVGYLHSHLPSIMTTEQQSALYLPDFCLGEETEIRDIMESLYIKYQPEMFEMFLYTIDSIVKWESLEGVPYIKIKDIAVGSKENIVSNFVESHLDGYYENIRREMHSFNLDFVFSENRYKIKNNEKFDKHVHNVIKEKFSVYYDKLLVTKVGNIYYGYSHPKIKTAEDLKKMFVTRDRQPHFYLRNEKIVFNIEPYTGELPDINNYKVHPKFLEYVSTKLEQELHEKSITKSAVEKYHQLINA